MHRLAAVFLLAVPVFAGAQTPTSVAGKWKVTSSIGGTESTAKCTFTQTGTDLAGTCTGQQGDVKITGKVDGANVSWSYASDYNGTALVIKYVGKLSAGKITGESTVEPFSVSGDFTATPDN